MFCQNCGHKNEDGAVFCEVCGMKLEENFHGNAHFQNMRETNSRNSDKNGNNRDIKKGIIIGAIVTFAVVLLCAIIIYGPDLLKNDKNNSDKNSVESVATDNKKDTDKNSDDDNEKYTDSIAFADSNEENENLEEDNSKEDLEMEDDKGEVDKTEDKNDKEPAAIGEIPVIFVGASSTLPQKDIIHYPKRTIDDDLSTAWSEGVDGSGIGESIDFGFDTFFNVSSITIWNGYHKSEKLYYANNRPKRIRVDVSNSEESFEIELRDIMEPQTIELPNPISTNHVSFTIEDVYYGNSFDDTCITEVKFFGN